MKWLSLWLFALPVWAAPADSFDVAASIGALALVVALILFLAWLLKKMRFPMMGGASDLSIVRQLPIGTKERIMVVQAGEEQFLIGVTAQSIQLLSKLEQPLKSAKESSPAAASSFAQQLSQVIKRHDK